MNKFSLISLVSVLTAVLASCSDNAVETATEAGTGPVVLVGKVQLDGSSTVFPISEAVAEEFGAVA
ncbi:MAG: phosphate transport system substrate-binding protein, partial [Candidatus Azotimanducaceae bacterium]